MSEYLQKYNDIMKKYHYGKFSETQKTMRDILYRAEEPNLFDKMSLDDLQYLIENTSGIHKQMFNYLKSKKEQEVQEL